MSGTKETAPEGPAGGAPTTATSTASALTGTPGQQDTTGSGRTGPVANEETPDPATTQDDTSRSASTSARVAPVRRGRSIWKHVLQVGTVVLGVGAAALLVARDWDGIRPALGQLSPLGMGISFVLGAASIVANFVGWRVMLAGFGARPARGPAGRIFFIGQLGKYLPGGIWPVAVQMELGRQYRVPRMASAAAMTVYLAVSLGTALVAGGLSLPLLAREGQVGGPSLWTLAVLPPLLVVLWPPVLRRLMGVALRLTRRAPMTSWPSNRVMLTAAGLALSSWILQGLHLYALLVDLDGGGGPLLALQATGAFAAAWSVGFLAAPAPAGAGAREAALILLLGGAVSGGVATVATVLSRLLLTVADVGAGLAALVLIRRGRHDSPQDDAAGSGQD